MVHNDADHLSAIKELWESKGFKIDSLSMKQIDWHQHENAMSLKEELNSILEGNQLFKGVIWLHPRLIGSKEELDSDGDIWLQQALIFSGAIKSRLATEGPILYVAQGSGNLGSYENGSFQIAQSLSALAKTVQAEWVATHGRFIDLHKDFESTKLAELVWQEWNDPNLSRNQVGWDQNFQRWEYERVLHIPQLSQQELPLSSRVWLVSGGAKGVTSDCLLALAKLSPDTFILLGRTVLEDEPAWASEVPDKDLKEAFLNEFKTKGEKATPKLVNKMIKQVQASREINFTIQKLKELGATPVYVQADISNHSALGDTIKPIIQQHGEITGLIHGAGVLADRKLEQKSIQDFELVYGTKINGFRNLWKVLDPSKLSHVLLFSSGAGFFGNPGQSDYAIANEAINQIAWDLNRNHPHIKVVSYNWGPWDGGMVDENLKKLFQQRGVQVIPRGEGAKLFAETALSNDQFPSPIFVVGNDIRGKDLPISAENWEESIFLKLEDNTLFTNHSIGGVPVLPATYALALLLRASEDHYQGYKVQKFQNFKVLQGLRFDEQISHSFTIKGSFVGESNETIQISVALQSSEKKKSLTKQHYQVEVFLAASLPKPTRQIIAHPWEPSKFEAYENGTLFHENYFKVLSTLSKNEISSFEVNLPPVPIEKIKNWVGNQFAPLLLDAGLQAMLVKGREMTNLPSLPLSIESGSFLAPLRSSKNKIKIEDEKLSGTSQLLANLVFLDESNNCVLRLEGVAVTFSEKLKPMFQNKSKG
ncbi:MAG: SDR family NAD(P)-dependent oxidoreductase [Proteobacteria bacterium]|nr:SDR family NAD(P)-dependent oxidoreductase [Pseudomonadota bacterium]